MRVITGTARGIQLKTPDGMTTRPTTDRVKEAMFSIIQFELPGASVLDLFGGTGQPAPAQDPDAAGGPEGAAAQGEKISRGDPGLKQVRIQRLHPSKDYALPGAQRKKALSRGASDLNEQAPPQILFPSHSVRSRY